MKKTFSLLALAVVAFASCTKKTQNTNIMIEPQPAYIVSGVHDVTIVNQYPPSYTYPYYGVGYQMPITVTYNDSAQDAVSLSLSALPAGIVMDTTWITSGIPTFATTLTFYDTSANGATIGTYPMTLTATSSVYGKKTYSFNLRITNPPSCTSTVVGKYSNCTSSCSTYTYYSDSITDDATVVNKVWFNNFAGMGVKIYGRLNCSTGSIIIPSQTAGGVTYSGTANMYSSHTVSCSYTASSSSYYCNFTMN